MEPANTREVESGWRFAKKSWSATGAACGLNRKPARGRNSSLRFLATSVVPGRFLRDPGTTSINQLRASAPAAALARLVAVSAFSVIVLAGLAMFTLAGLAAIRWHSVVVPLLALAAVLLFGLGRRPVLLLAHFAFTPYGLT